jgi:hypothetical protein
MDIDTKNKLEKILGILINKGELKPTINNIDLLYQLRNITLTGEDALDIVKNVQNEELESLRKDLRSLQSKYGQLNETLEKERYILISNYIPQKR